MVFISFHFVSCRIVAHLTITNVLQVYHPEEQKDVGLENGVAKLTDGYYQYVHAL